MKQGGRSTAAKDAAAVDMPGSFRLSSRTEAGLVGHSRARAVAVPLTFRSR